MADYVLSNKADDDLGGIYLYSHRTFGEAKADAYFLSLRDCLQALAESPELGRPVPQLHAGLLCFRHARHIVFYMKDPQGIFVVRVLHDAMDFIRHLEPGDEGDR